MPQLLRLVCLESVLHKRSHRNKKPSTATREQPLLPQREKMVNSNKDLLPPKKRYTHGNRRDERGEVHPYDQVKAEEAGRERLHVRTLEREQQVTAMDDLIHVCPCGRNTSSCSYPREITGILPTNTMSQNILLSLTF